MSDAPNCIQVVLFHAYTFAPPNPPKIKSWGEPMAIRLPSAERLRLVPEKSDALPLMFEPSCIHVVSTNSNIFTWPACKPPASLPVAPTAKIDPVLSKLTAVP